MAAETHTIDPVSEDATNTALLLTNPTAGIDLITYSSPAPEQAFIWAGSADTDGDPLADSRYKNRQITVGVRCYGTEAVMRAKVRECTKKAGKLADIGGTYQRTCNDGTTVTYDIVTCEIDVPTDWQFVQRNSCIVTFMMTAKPKGRGTPVVYTTHTETTNPEIIFTEVAPAGDVPALGKLEITDGSGQDQQFVQWGIRCRNYGTATTNALAFAGTSRLALNSAASAAVTGAVTGNLLQQTSITPTYAAMMSMASSGTAYPTHVGDYTIWARTYQGATNTDDVTMAFEWATGDLGVWTQNTAVSLGTATNGQFRHVPLGQVHLPVSLRGQQRWDGRVIVKTDAATASVGVDRVYVIPVGEGYGEVRAIAPTGAPSTFLARDEFNQTAGAVVGKSLPTGGVWAGSAVVAPGTADFVVDATSHYLTRTSNTVGSRVVHNNTNYANLAMQCDVNTSASANIGLMARFVDLNNNFQVLITPTGVGVSKLVAATSTSIGTDLTTGHEGVWKTVRVLVDTAGRWGVYLGPQGGALPLILSGQHADLATGGALATGKAGPYDIIASTSARFWDNFRIWTPATDAAPFASQSLEIGPTYAIREDSSGTAWGPVASYHGDYLRVPAANVGGTVQVIAKASRNDPDTSTDAGVDDISATLTVTPLYLHAP